MTRLRWILGIFLALVLAAPATGENPTRASLVRLKDIAVEPRADGVAVQLYTTSQVQYRHALIDTPYRVVVDLEGTLYGWRKTPLPVDADPLRQIRGSQYRKGVTRVVLQLSRKAAYHIDGGPKGLSVMFEKPVTPGPAEPKNAGVQPLGTPVLLAVTAIVPSPIRVAQVQTSQAPPLAPGQRLISLDFKDADIHNLFRILAAESGKNFVIGEDVKGKISITLRNVTWELALETILEARGLEKIEKDNIIRIVSREQLTKDQETKAKAEEAKLKAEAEIRTKIAEAQIKEQEVLQRKLAAEAARAEAQARGPLKEELIRLAYRDPEEVAKTLLGLLGVTEGAPPVTGPPLGGPPLIAEPPFSALYGPPAQPPPPRPGPSPPAEILAKGITIRADKPTNSIFIRHYEADLERIKKLIREKLDIPLPQVKIEARLNLLSRTDLFSIGIQWGGAGVTRDSANILVGQGFTQPLNPGTGVAPVLSRPRFNLLPSLTNPLVNTVSPLPPLSGFLPIDPKTALPIGGNIVNLPLVAGTPAGAIAFGIIGTRFNLNLALQALETQNKTQSLAKPEIVTVENSKANISLGEEIPYATVSSAGTQIQFKEAVLKLEVIPTVIREPDVTKVKMKVVVENNSRGQTVNSPAGAIPAIAKRKAETEVIVKEGETLVIGGITQREQSETITKVPLLGDIPLLGWLFKQRTVQVDPNRELVIFITPTVLKIDQQPKPAPSQTGKPKGP